MCQISIIQRLKANHNCSYYSSYGVSGVPNINYSKIESKSQPVGACFCVEDGVPNINYSKIESKSQQDVCSLRRITWCAKYQLFKDWKQITTVGRHITGFNRVCQISIIQRLKANHNTRKDRQNSCDGVPNINYSKIESKSQRLE